MWMPDNQKSHFSKKFFQKGKIKQAKNMQLWEKQNILECAPLTSKNIEPIYQLLFPL